MREIRSPPEKQRHRRPPDTIAHNAKRRSANARKIGISCALDIVFNLSLLFSLVVTTPLYTSLATILVVPFTALADFLLHGTTVAPQAVAGMALICLGFALLQVPPAAAQRAAAWGRRRCGRSCSAVPWSSSAGAC
jgi:hypothetical protein